MSLKVIGAGFGRTGTLSLKYALEKLGFNKCYHTSEILKFHPEHVRWWMAAAEGREVEWDELFHGYQATVDFPGCLFYQELLQKYPEAKVILTSRDSHGWYASTEKTIYSQTTIKRKIRRPFRALTMKFRPDSDFYIQFARLQNKIIWEGVFSGRFMEKEYAIEMYQKHNDEVREFVPKSQLLEMNISEGWEPLCDFLGVTIPQNVPFPHANRRRMFGRRSRKHPKFQER